MSQIPAPLLSRHLGVVVIVLSVLAGVGLGGGLFLGLGPLVAAIAVTVVQQAFLALAILVIGRTGLAGRHDAFAVLATLGSAGILIVDALAITVGTVLALLGPLPPVGLVVPVAAVLAGLTGVLFALFGAAVLRAGVVRPVVRVLPLVAGIVVLAAAVAAVAVPWLALPAAPAVAVLLSGGIGLALFTRRTLK